jgi:hypothetical protein
MNNASQYRTAFPIKRRRARIRYFLSHRAFWCLLYAKGATRELASWNITPRAPARVRNARPDHTWEPRGDCRCRRHQSTSRVTTLPSSTTLFLVQTRIKKERRDSLSSTFSLFLSAFCPQKKFHVSHNFISLQRRYLQFFVLWSYQQHYVYSRIEQQNL